MAPRTPAEVLALWQNIRTNYTTFKNTAAVTDEDVLIWATAGQDTGGGGGGAPGGATETTLAAILTQLQGDRSIAAHQFIDATGSVYLKVLAFSADTNTYTSTNLTLAGTSYTPTAPETPLSKKDADTTETIWEITTAGTGYSVGDVVSQFTLISQGPPISVLGVLWYNQTTDAALAVAPSAGHRRRVGAVAATESTVSEVSNRIGGATETAPATDTASSGLNGRLQRISQRLSSLIGLLPTSVGSKPANAGLAVSLAQKTTIQGITSVGANTNLLDTSGAGAPLDVTQYQSAEILVVSTNSGGSYQVQGSLTPTFTSPQILTLYEQGVLNQAPSTGAITVTVSVRRFRVDLQGVNFLRFNLLTTTNGVTPAVVLSQLAPSRADTVVVSGNVGLAGASQSQLTALAPITDIGSSAITVNNTTTGFQPTWGVSQYFSIFVSAVAGTATPTYNFTVQETLDGSVWQDVYSFPPITATGLYVSPLIAMSGRQYRYVQTVSGTTPSFTRSVVRYTSHIAVEPIVRPTVSSFLAGVVADSDRALPTNARILSFTMTNESGVTLYLQVHPASAALVSGVSAPTGAAVWRIPNGSTAYEGVAFFGKIGKNYGVSQRLAISTTRVNYTAPSAGQMAGVSLRVETI